MNNAIKSLTLLLLFATSFKSYAQEGTHYGAKETFKYWAETDPWDGIEVLNGQYWASDHWTKEYILYMEVKVPVKMALDFIEDNGLKAVNDPVKFPKDAPAWFTPPSDYKEFSKGTQGSKYFINKKTGHLFIYEIQL